MAKRVGVSRVTDTWRVMGRAPMEATKVMVGRKERERDRFRFFVGEARGVGVRVEVLLRLVVRLVVGFGWIGFGLDGCSARERKGKERKGKEMLTSRLIWIR